MLSFELNALELAEIEDMLSKLCARYRAIDTPEFLSVLSSSAQELPARLRSFLNEFRMQETAGGVHIRGFKVDDLAIGATPGHWSHPKDAAVGLREEFFFVLCATLLGDIFGWATQQGGRLINEVLPIREHAHRQINSGSAADLLWHTEDAFHPYRADYVGLFCLRNPDGIETTIAEIQGLHLDAEMVRVLFQERFVLMPDEAHLPQSRDTAAQRDSESAAVLARSYARLEQMLVERPKTAILFGDPQSPYVRLDSDGIDRTVNDPEAMTALDQLMAAIDKNLCGVALQPGEVIFIDNYRAVHGRRAFSAHYNGHDRWLKRVNVSRDLRRSRDARITCADRIIY